MKEMINVYYYVGNKLKLISNKLSKILKNSLRGRKRNINLSIIRKG